MKNRLRHTASHGLGAQKSADAVFSKNHFASASPMPMDIQSQINAMMLRRVAGNTYECPSNRDFWQVKGTKIVKLVGSEVSNGESIAAAPSDQPAAFLAGILDDLEF